MAGGLLFAAVAVIAGAPMAQAAVQASIVVDAQNGAVLCARNAETPAHPASLTKLMTLFITFQQLEKGRLKLNQELPVSAHAAAQQPTKLWLKPGSKISVRSAILGITTMSANDAAVVLAEAIGGTEPRFAQRMTTTARELGMTHTQFRNATGLPTADNWTTAQDMAKLAVAIIHDFPADYGYFGVRSFRFHGRVIHSDDHVLREFPGADGMKTGYIRASGFNLVTSAVRNKRRLVAVVLGGRTARARDREMIALLNREFRMAPAPETVAAKAPAGSAAEARYVKAVPSAPRFAKADLQSAETAQAASPSCVIQIGGYFSSEYAVRRVLRSAVESVPGLLTSRSELVVKTGGRDYSARFWRLNADQALRACHALKQKGYTCTMVRGPAREDNLARVSSSEASRAD